MSLPTGTASAQREPSAGSWLGLGSSRNENWRPSFREEPAPRPRSTLFLPTPNPHFTFPQESQQGPRARAGRWKPSRLAGCCASPEGLRPDQGPPRTRSWSGGRGGRESYCVPRRRSEGGALPSGRSEPQGPTAPTLSKASICADQTEGEGWAPSLHLPSRPFGPHVPCGQRLSQGHPAPDQRHHRALQDSARPEAGGQAPCARPPS